METSEKRMVKILNFGSLNLDYTYDVPHFVTAGETLSSVQMRASAGGKGLNQSIAASRSGAEIYHAGAVGQTDGGMLLEVLRGAGVDTRWIARVPEATGHAIIQRDPAGQNCILLFSGANQTITPEQARGVLGQFAPGDWLMLQNEISAVEQLMELAHSMWIRIAFNPSPMTEAVRTYPLHLADLLIFNEIEAAGICGVEACAGEQLLSLLGQRFPQSQVVLTLGGAGAWYHCGETTVFQPAFSVPVTDTTGAGDTFTGYLLGGLIQKLSPAEAMRQAAAAAALAVTRRGAAGSIPEREEVQRFLQQHS